MTPPIRRATSLRPGQFKHLARVASVTGRMPERDVFLIWITHSTGVRVTELAQLEIGSVLFPSGAVRPEVYLSASITKHSRARNIYLTHPKCLKALERWLEVRVNRRWGFSGADEYRGLRPNSKVVMTFKGEAFELAFKHRMLDTGPEVYRCCDACNRRSVVYTARRESKAVRRIVEGELWPQRCWPLRGTLKSYRPF